MSPKTGEEKNCKLGLRCRKYVGKTHIPRPQEKKKHRNKPKLLLVLPTVARVKTENAESNIMLRNEFNKNNCEVFEHYIKPGSFCRAGNALI